MDTTNTNAQNIVGKTYQAAISQTCKLMEGGGCVVSTYCVLAFEKDSVDVFYYINAKCTPKEREARYNTNKEEDRVSYKWSVTDNIISIKGFDDYGQFEYQNEKLIVTKKNDDVSEFKEKKLIKTPN